MAFAAFHTAGGSDEALRKELMVLQAAARESLRREVKMRAELSAEQQQRLAAEAALAAAAATSSPVPPSPGADTLDAAAAAMLMERLEAAEAELKRLRAAATATPVASPSKPSVLTKPPSLETRPSVDESVLSLEMEDMDRWLVDVPDAQQLEACASHSPPWAFCAGVMAVGTSRRDTMRLCGEPAC
jgi:hypothetical protein